MGLNSSKRKLSGTLNCPTTADSRVIKKILSFPILPRNSIERFPHVIFLGSFNEIKAWKNLSGLTLYFTERKARYSPNGKFLCLEPYALRARGLPRRERVRNADYTGLPLLWKNAVAVIQTCAL